MSPPPPSSSRRRFRWGRALLYLGLLYVLAIAFGFFGLPPLLRKQGEKQLSATLGRPVSIEKIRLNPLIFSAEITGFKIDEKGGEKFVGWKRLYVNFNPWARLTGKWAFAEIELLGFTGFVARDAQGRLNFADVMEKISAQSTQNPREDRSKPTPLAIDRLVVEQAEVQFKDLSQGTPFETTVGPVTFTLHHFKTSGDGVSPHAFTAASETGETVTWNGTLSLEPLRSAGSLSFNQFLPGKYAPYYEDKVGFMVQRGTVSLSGNYEAEFTEGKPRVKLSKGALTLKDLQLSAQKKSSSEPQITLHEVTLSDIQADSANLEGSIGRIAITGGNVQATRTANGIDLMTLFAPPQVSPSVPALSGATSPPSPSAASAGATNASLPKISVGEVSLTDISATLRDQTLPRVAEVKVEKLAVLIKELKSHDLTHSLPLELSIALAGGGAVAIKGALSAQPLEGKVNVAISQIPLALGAPYLESMSALRAERGEMELHGDVTLVGGAISFTGQTQIQNLAISTGNSGTELISWSSLGVKGIKAVSAPASVSIDDVVLAGLNARVVIAPDGTLNLSQLTGPKEGGEAEPPTPPTSPKPSPSVSPSSPLPPLSVARIQLENAQIGFSDQSMRPAVQSQLSKLQGTITGVSSTEVAKGDVKLTAVVNETAPVTIAGRLNPLGNPAFADVKLEFKSIELSPVAPYVAKYVGYGLERGALSLDIHFKLSDRKIQSADVATLDQFTLGAKNDSPDAVKLPITLAIALLKDRSGRIVLDVPIEGSLDDPNFRIGRVVWRVIGNLIAKAATSPFALLGSMFGGGGEDLAFQLFAPGAVTHLASEEKKLETVTNALINRPQLRLDLAGSYDPTSDRKALQLQEVEQRILATAKKARPADGSLGSSPTEIPAEEASAALVALYVAAFPESASKLDANTESQHISPSPPEEQARPADSDGGVLRRIRRLFSRDKKAAQNDAKAIRQPTFTESSPSLTSTAPLPSTDDMRNQLAERVEIDDNALVALAQQRAQSIRARLLESKDISADRVFIVTPVAKGPRVELRLK
ncbi:MAG TPA: DUF748 domain-containing protein [Opitutaceae bacterium]|nr:DUF748 domain-containing protein [Opitutaceae bacterium]